MQVLAPLPQSSSGSAFILPGRAVQNQVHWRSYAGSGQTSKIQLQTRLTCKVQLCRIRYPGEAVPALASPPQSSSRSASLCQVQLAESGTMAHLCLLWPHREIQRQIRCSFARYSSTYSQTLVQLCRIWPHLRNPAQDPHPFCQVQLAESGTLAHLCQLWPHRKIQRQIRRSFAR
jgi:hypothetical protein